MNANAICQRIPPPQLLSIPKVRKSHPIYIHCSLFRRFCSQKVRKSVRVPCSERANLVIPWNRFVAKVTVAETTSFHYIFHDLGILDLRTTETVRSNCRSFFGLSRWNHRHTAYLTGMCVCVFMSVCPCHNDLSQSKRPALSNIATIMSA